MGRKIGFAALALVALITFACNRRGTGDIHVQGDTYVPPPVVTSPYKVKVVDVFNDTHQVYDVDIIGLVWNGIEDSLKKRGMLWTQNAEGDPYIMEAHVEHFKKGEMPECFIPRLGDTDLVVRVELSRAGVHIATIDSRQKSKYGMKSMKPSAWKKIFDKVCEDVVDQAVKKF